MKNDTKDDKIQETINESANNVENNTLAILANTEWKEIMENSYFTDPIEKKLREIDILAINNFYPGFGTKERHRTIFLIECKYIKDRIVFWFKNKKMDKANALTHRNYVLEKCPYEQCSCGASAQGHFMKNDKIAKKWDYVKWDESGHKAKKECHDVIGKSINQLANALYYYSRISEPTKNNSIIFPILVINDYKNVFKVEECGGYSNIKSRFQLEVERSIKIDNHCAEDFYQLIDVVSVEELKNFIDDFSKTTLHIINQKIIQDYRIRDFNRMLKK